MDLLDHAQDPQHTFVQVAEFSQGLKQRWHLDSFGARTEELLRNSLHVLSDAGMTLVELSLLLTSAEFRRDCLKHTRNEEIKAYFETRYDTSSESMQDLRSEI